MKFGIDRLIAEPALRAPLAGRRVALLAHPASVTRDLVHSLDALATRPDIRLCAAKVTAVGRCCKQAGHEHHSQLRFHRDAS